MLFALLIAAAVPKDDPCKGASTPEVNACLAGKLERSKARLAKYLQAAVDRHDSGEGAAVRLGIQAAQASFEAYRAIECQTVYEDWKDGTIRGAMALSCELRLTDQRTRDIWEQWLRYMDGTPPILPEPKPTE